MLIDRRRAIGGTLAAAAALALPARLAARAPLPDLFVFDGRFEPARLAAAAMEQAGVPVFDRNAIDLGQAWRGPIPARLSALQGRITGITSWVDSYICEVLGGERGLAILREPVTAGAVLTRWTLA